MLKWLVVSLAVIVCAVPVTFLGWPAKSVCKYCHQPYGSWKPRVIVWQEPPKECFSTCAWFNDKGLLFVIDDLGEPRKHLDDEGYDWTVWRFPVEIPDIEDNTVTFRCVIRPDCIGRFAVGKTLAFQNGEIAYDKFAFSGVGGRGELEIREMFFDNGGAFDIDVRVRSLNGETVPTDSRDVVQAQIWKGFISR